jgi:hypothetical protein
MLVGLWRADEDIQRWLPQNLYPKMQNERILRHIATSACEDTRAAMALMQHGLWPQAQEIFYKAIQKKSNPAATGVGPQVGREEMCLWEERWLEATRQMNQWDVLSEFAKGVDHISLQVECLWRSGEWAALKETILPRAQLQMEESERLHIVKAYIALQEGQCPAFREHSGNIR